MTKMLENTGLLLTLCIVLFIGLGFPISLLLAAKRGEKIHELDLYKKAAKGLRNPWKREDDSLEELSKRVEELKDK